MDRKNVRIVKNKDQLYYFPNCNINQIIRYKDMLINITMNIMNMISTLLHNLNL